jgi:hypothetical protein
MKNKNNKLTLRKAELVFSTNKKTALWIKEMNNQNKSIVKEIELPLVNIKVNLSKTQ